jgi:hypothetical protein
MRPVSPLPVDRLSPPVPWQPTAEPYSRCGVIFEEDFESTSSSMGATTFSGYSYWVVQDPGDAAPDDFPIHVQAAEGTNSAWAEARGYPPHYDFGCSSMLYTPPIDFAGSVAPVLSFSILYLTDWQRDGLNILITPDLGASLYLLEPESGYPDAYVESLGSPGYSGTFDREWRAQRVDLSLLAERFSDTPWTIAFHFASDDSYDGPILGVFIDAVRIQAPCVPTLGPALTAAAPATLRPTPTRQPTPVSTEVPEPPQTEPPPTSCPPGAPCG